ncbi:MAG: hypothetical protein E7254_07625 [Lachnospiraceae bacterium]|nr:hypothetical protein [Lachnospiraceae bacterium]
MRMVIRRIVATFLVISLVSGSEAITIFAMESTSNKKVEEKQISVGELGGYLATSSKAIKKLNYEKRFKLKVGHGYAAEEANNLSDVLKGKNAKVVGGDNAKNGPDRKIYNRDGSITWIQDKYYSTAKKSVEAAFDSETGMYRYMTPDGKPMDYELAKDQYEEAVELFAEKIKAGKIEGVKNPDEAKNIVKAGNITFDQAKNITKAFNKDSLLYDSANGVITATCALGISFILNYASCIINGKSTKDAIEYSCVEALQSGGEIFCAYVIASQLSKVSLKEALVPTKDAIVKCFGDDFAKSLLEAVEKNTAGLSNSVIIQKVGKELGSKIKFNGVFIVILEVPDIVDIYRGRISKEQFVKNLSVTLASLGGAVAAGKAGAAIGTSIAPGAGTVVGVVVGVVGGVVGGAAANKITSYIYEGDAEKMFKIVTEEFQKLGEEYLITRDEADKIVEQIKDKFDADTLKDMFSSKNQKKFAKDLMKPYFEKQIAKRKKIKEPSEDEVRLVYKKSLAGVIFIH